MSAAAIYPRLFAKLFRSPLMIHAQVRQSFEQTLLTRMFGQEWAEGKGWNDRNNFEGVNARADGSAQKRSTLGAPHSGAYERDFEDAADWSKARDEFKARMRIENIYRKVGKVAVIKVEGVIDKRISQFDMDCYGGCDLSDVDIALGDAAADTSLKKVMLYVNSPGGSVTGTPETAARVAALAKIKRVEAFVDVMACSAGYYIASQANKIIAAPSAIIGSIGVYMAVIDATRAMELEGIAVQMISSGKYKGMGAPWKPLSDEERNMLQAQCDSIYAAFKGSVSASRPKVKDSTMQGQWFDGEQADDLQLVDELTLDTPDERVSKMLV